MESGGMQPYKYHVVQFDTPYVGVRKYACVPFSWIRVSTAETKEVRVAYPVTTAELANIEQVVRNESIFDKHWPWHFAYAKHGTDSYECALRLVESETCNATTVEDEIGNAGAQLDVLQISRVVNSSTLSNAADNIIRGNLRKGSNVSTSHLCEATDETLNSPEAALFQNTREEGNVSSSNVVANEIFDRIVTSTSEANASLSNLEEYVREEANVSSSNFPADDSFDGNVSNISEANVSFSYPEEYDPFDDRWTLRYQEYREGLVPLPNQNQNPEVWIDQRRHLDQADFRALSETLLKEVFRPSALKICTRTGKYSDRPGLNKNGIVQITTYVCNATGTPREMVIRCITEKLSYFHTLNIEALSNPSI